MDREPYRYQKFISDIAGQDPKAHYDDPRQLVISVRDWINARNSKLPGAVGRSGMSTCASKNGCLSIAEKRNWMSPTSLFRTTARQYTNGCMIGNSLEKWYREEMVA